MTSKVKNIIKISAPGGSRVRVDKTNTISVTKNRDEIVLDIETKDIKPLYFDEISAKIFMNSPEYRAGIFPVKCDDRKIEVLCGQDDCAAYVSGESQPISVLPPTISDPPPECPNPPCTPCPQQCDDGTCPPCDPPPIPCPCQGSGGLATAGSFFPNCPPNPCGAACPCPDGGCPPCDGGCECPDCLSPCDDGGCPPCSPPECPPGAGNAAGSECCMEDRGGHCMTVTTLQYGFTTQMPECPTGVNGTGEDAKPTWDDDPEFLCSGESCNCPCGSDPNNLCNSAKGENKSSDISNVNIS